MLIKVCGMRHPDRICQVAALRPDMMGFIFYPGSPRYIETPECITRLPQQIHRVGVFVNEGYDGIMEIVERYNLSIVQLHGSETPELCYRFRDKGLQVIKAVRIGDQNSFRQTDTYEECCDWFLFDTLSKLYGGSGKAFDWEWLECYEGKIPFLLSGGIGPDRIEDIRQLKHSRFAGIDLNSRFEKSPGCKDISLLSNFFCALNF